ncbi:hypothetical protein [Photobacterium nomapromontoriensis]|uniref:hypothetical protein n=1 Tax=Photobacterium nomapromontoriensis TaxID=2910237 RepID=UPI003D1478F7
MIAKVTMLAMLSATSTAVYGVTESLTSPRSMMSSSISQFIQGDFTTYTSDVVALIALAFNAVIITWKIRSYIAARKYAKHQ